MRYLEENWRKPYIHERWQKKFFYRPTDLIIFPRVGWRQTNNFWSPAWLNFKFFWKYDWIILLDTKDFPLKWWNVDKFDWTCFKWRTCWYITLVQLAFHCTHLNSCNYNGYILFSFTLSVSVFLYLCHYFHCIVLLFQFWQCF